MLFSTGTVETTIEESFKNPNEILEMLIVDEVSHLSDEKIQEFCQPGGVGETLVQEGKLRNKTLVRLSKSDDLTRRTKQMAYKIAREKNDPLWDKLELNRKKERDLIEKIVAKYGTKGERLAKQSQKDYLSAGSKLAVLPKSFMKSGGEDRVS